MGSEIPGRTFQLLERLFHPARRAQSTKESLAEAYDQAHARTLQVLESVKDEEWEYGAEYPDWGPLLGGHVALERLFHYIKVHFESHASDIRRALGKNSDQYDNEGSRG